MNDYLALVWTVKDFFDLVGGGSHLSLHNYKENTKDWQLEKKREADIITVLPLAVLLTEQFA